jgi:hypothetical protein
VSDFINQNALAFLFVVSFCFGCFVGPVVTGHEAKWIERCAYGAVTAVAVWGGVSLVVELLAFLFRLGGVG